MLTVACVFTTGPYPYTAEYVVRLAQMVRRHLSRDYRFVCLTNRMGELAITTMVPNPPVRVDIHAIDGLDGIVPPNGAGYWNKVRLFDRSFGFTGRVLYLDLDTLVVSSLDPIVDFPASFALCADELATDTTRPTKDRYGRRIVRKFNSSVMVWDAGTVDYLFDDFRPDVPDVFSTDQDWIGYRVEGGHEMPVGWFPRISSARPPWSPEAKVILCKKPKCHVARERWPWFAEWWGE